jgi:hypothetical protein
MCHNHRRKSRFVEITMPMHSEKIPFDHALSAIREGNPWPMLSDRTEFPSEPFKSAWRQKAIAMVEALDSIYSRNFSIRIADEIERIYVSDPDTKNLERAKRFLTQTLSFCNSVTDEAYSEFLSGIIPSRDVAEAIPQSRRYSEHVAAHIKTLLENLPHD